MIESDLESGRGDQQHLIRHKVKITYVSHFQGGMEFAELNKQQQKYLAYFMAPSRYLQ